MKVYSQEDSECLLATIASVADVPYATVRNKAREILAVPGFESWAQMSQFAGMLAKHGGTTLWWKMVEEAVLAFKLPMGLFVPPILHSALAPAHRNPVVTMSDIPAVGRGTLMLAYEFGPKHIAAFENGLVYDSANPRTALTGRGCTLAVELEDWNGQGRLCYVEGITALKSSLV